MEIYIDSIYTTKANKARMHASTRIQGLVAGSSAPALHRGAREEGGGGQCLVKGNEHRSDIVGDGNQHQNPRWDLCAAHDPARNSLIIVVHANCEVDWG